MSEPDLATTETAPRRSPGGLDRPFLQRRAEFEEALSRNASDRGAEAGASLPRASLWGDALHRFMKNKASVVAAVAFLLLLAFVIFVPWLSNEDPYALDFSQAYQSPSWAHPFGRNGCAPPRAGVCRSR